MERAETFSEISRAGAHNEELQNRLEKLVGNFGTCWRAGRSRYGGNVVEESDEESI